MTTEDRAAITALLAELVDAWARHDADTYAGLFTEHATYVTYVGTVYQGRQEIGEMHRILWDKFAKGTRLADEVIDIRFHGQYAAIVTTRGDTYKGTPPAKLSKVQTYTVVRDGGVWRFAAFQNTKRKPLLEAISFKTAPGMVPAAAR